MIDLRALVFKHRGALLAAPALVLAAAGKPSALSVAAGIPLALAGEALRCWAVGYSGTTTRADVVTAPSLITAGPYAHVRNPLYLGNFLTALGFTVAFTGGNSGPARAALAALALGTMVSVYATIVPHEEAYLRRTFGAAFDDYAARVPAVIPLAVASQPQEGVYDPSVIARAESRTFATFGAMLAVLALKGLRM
ncbi:MAG: isoprenylcysteine carboxylmethyltransferase family protein [Candidatus Eremiobacteraeota bacterium]|nr:isoprenylcysteine carboxylmethyltransferase family protein [Candidatus Eremiobacteraeota bacterium]